MPTQQSAAFGMASGGQLSMGTRGMTQEAANVKENTGDMKRNTNTVNIPIQNQ